MNGEASEACAVGLGVACQRVPAGRQVRSVVAADRGDGAAQDWVMGTRCKFLKAGGGCPTLTVSQLSPGMLVLKV
jgi:hypothetical protein